MNAKTGLLLALMASAAMSGHAFAQSASTTSGTTSSGTAATSGSTEQGGTSGSGSGSTTSSGGMSGSSSANTGAAPGTQTPNPNVYGESSGQQQPQQQQGNWGGGNWSGNWSWGGPGMMMPGGFSVMNCMSPAPMGGPGSFACYPASPMAMGWHHPRFDNDHSPGRRWHSRERRETTPNGYYQDRQDYRRKSQDSYRSDGYDDDNRTDDGRGPRYDNRGGYDDRDDEDYSN